MFQADEPADVGGGDIGPNPLELLMASLGACTNITVQMYAERHQWPFKGVQSVASYIRALAEITPGCHATIGIADRIELEISVAGGLSQEQEQKPLEIVSRCPIHPEANFLDSGLYTTAHESSVMTVQRDNAEYASNQRVK